MNRNEYEESNELFAEDELVRFENDEAIISFNHDWFATQSDIDIRKNYAQAIFSERLRREVSLEDIQINLKIGDPILSQTVFAVRLGDPLYIGLGQLYQNNPAAIFNLIASLYGYCESHEITPSQATLLFYTVNQLEKLSDVQG